MTTPFRSAARTLAALVALGTAATPLGAQLSRRTDDSYRWDGRVPRGRWLYLRNVNGEIRVDRSDDDRIHVQAIKRWRRGDPDDVRITNDRSADGESVVVCALYDRDDTCDERGYRSSGRDRRWNEGDDVSVTFVVRVPAGVRIDARTTNGDLRVVGATSEIVARTTNGSVRAESSGGPVSARTTNGNVDATMREIGDARDLEFATTNGSVTVEVPSSLSAALDMSTTNGRVSSDFPLTLRGTISPRRVQATVGDGAVRMRLHSTNGNIDLRRARQ